MALVIIASTMALMAVLNYLRPSTLNPSGGVYGEVHLGGMGIVVALYVALVDRIRRLGGSVDQGIGSPAVEPINQMPLATMKLAAVRGATAWLVIRNGPGQGDVREINGDKAFVGSRAGSAVHLDDSSVAPDHAVILVNQGKYSVSDLGSRTGTWVNGKLEAGAVLSDGNRISIGTSELFYSKVGAAEDDDGRGKGELGSGVLLVRSGPSMGRSFHVGRGDTIIGSNPGDSGARIDDPSISQRHALIRGMTKVCRLYDLASTNGTIVDGAELDGAVLKNGDVLKFGAVEVQFVHEESSCPPGPGCGANSTTD